MSNTFGASPRRGGRSYRRAGAGMDASVRAEARMRLLTANLGDFAANNPSVIARLAQAPTDDVAMMQDAIGAFGAIGITGLKQQLAREPAEIQQGRMATMHPTLRDALTQAGFSPAVPAPPPDDGFGIGDLLGMERIKDVGSGAKWLGGKALAGLAYPIEEVARTTRVGPIMSSQRRAQNESGMDADQLLAETGIDTRFAAKGDGWDVPVLGPALAALENPEDLLGAARTWKEIGHSGRDDYLADRQLDAYQLLEDEFPGRGKDLLRFAKAMIDGDTIEDIAEEEGFGPDQIQQFKDSLAVTQASEPFREAMNVLESARVSPGRSSARFLLGDPTRNVDEGWDRLLSGSVDATFQIAADPTIVAGKLTKAVRAVRWGVNAAEGVADVTRAQDLAKVWDNALKEVGGDVDRADQLIRATGVFEDVAPKTVSSKIPDFRVGDRNTRLIAEARAVHDPARAVADAFTTKDWDSLVRRFPAMQRSIRDMQFFDAALREAGDSGLDDVAQVFEFYKWTAGQRSVLDALGVTRTPQATKLFGHEGSGTLMIPHATGMQRARLATRTAFANWKDGVRPPNETELAALREAAEAAAGAADEAMEIDPHTLQWVTRESGWVRDQVRRLMTVASTKVPRSPIVMTGEQAMGPEEFAKFNNTLGIIGQTPKAVVRARYNQYINGNAGVRHAMGNQMILDTLEAAGLRGTEAGEAFVRKFIQNNNHIYGFDDLTKVGIIEGSADLLAHKALFETQTAEAFSIPTFKDWLVASRNVNKLRWVAGGVRKSGFEAAMVHVWKPGVLLRFGFPLRAGGEEALSFMLREGFRPYLREKLLVPWAGVRDKQGNLARWTSGDLLQAPTGAFKPHQFVADAFAHLAGVSDRALDESVVIQARRHVDWSVAGPQQRQEILDAAKAEILKDLPPLPKVIRKYDEFAKHLAVVSSNAVHATALGRKYLSRAQLAKLILERDPDFAARQANLRFMITHPTVQQAINQGNGFAMGTAASEFEDIDVLFERTIDIKDPSSPSGVRAVRMNRDGPWAWVGHQDLGMLTHHYHQNLRRLGESPSGSAALRQYAYLVSQEEIDEITAVFGGEGLDGVIEARDLYRAPDGTVDDLLEDLLIEDLEDVTPENLDNALLAKVQSLSKGAQELLQADLDDAMLTTSEGLADDRAVNAAYNALRRVNNSKELRKLVSASSMAGIPLKPGHTRVYVPMIDRRLAGDLIDLLSNPNHAERFAERLVAGLRRINATGEADALFDSITPEVATEARNLYTNFAPDDLATWMAGTKATLAQTGANRIPAGLAGSSNFQVAVALRDTIGDLVPPGTLKPTVGFIDHPDELFRAEFGVERVAESASVVRLAPHQTADMVALDPDNVQRLVHIKLPGKEGHTQWVTDAEVEEVIGIAGRVRGYKEKWSSRSQSFARVHEDGVVVANKDLIDADYTNGMSFFAGNGGTMRRTVGRYSWKNASDTADADTMIGLLEQAGLNDTTDLDFWKLIGHYRRSHGRNVPFSDEMVDAGLWERFAELAQAAKPGARAVTESWVDDAVAVQSRIAAEALNRLGADIRSAGRKGGPIAKAKYRKLMVERAKAHEVLRPAGERPALTVTEEAIQREMDALALAWKEAGLPTTPAMISRPAEAADENAPTILGEIWTTGATEEASVRRAAQAAAAEVRRAVFGAKSKAPLHEVIMPVLRRDFSADKMLRSIPLEEIPGAYGPRELTQLPNRFSQMVARGFDVIDPAIAALARQPMFADGFHKSMTHFEPVRKRLIDRDTASKAILMYRTALFDDPTVFSPIDDFLLAKFRVNKDFEGDDPLTNYARALFRLHADPEDGGAAAGVITSLAELHLGSRLTDEMDLEVREALLERHVRRLEGKVDPHLLARYHMNLSHAREAQVQRAATRAWEMVAPYIDDHSDRSAFQEFLGPVFLPFFYAEEQFLRRFARGVYETPHMIRKAQLMMNGLESMGVVREDETTGKRMLVIPGSDVFLETTASVAAIVTGNDAYRVDVGPLGMNVDYVLPGWNITESRFGFGPLIGMTTDFVVDRYPDLEWAGRRNPDHWWETLIPTSVARGYKLVAADPTEILTAEQSAIGYLEATDHGLPPDASASETTEYLENVRSTARAISAIRFSTGLGFFGSLTPLDEQAPFRKEFSELLASGVSLEAATEAMIKRHGPDGLIWTVFGSENQVGAPLPPTAESFEFMLDNETLMQDHPESMPWLIPQPSDGDEFDFRAYNEQLALGLRRRRTPLEFINQIRLAQSLPTYLTTTRERREGRKLLTEQNAPQPVKDAYDLETSAWKRGYLNMNPLIEESFTNDARERRRTARETLPTLIAGGNFGEQGAVLLPLLESYNAFRVQYDAYAGQNSKRARAIKEALAEGFYTEATLYVRRNPQAGPFFRSVIEVDLPDTALPDEKGAV